MKSKEEVWGRQEFDLTRCAWYQFNESERKKPAHLRSTSALICCNCPRCLSQRPVC